MKDITKVGIRAKLVILSCCHGSWGKIMKAELWALLASSLYLELVHQLLVPLWLLNDESTKDFMIRFYRHLEGDKLSASDWSSSPVHKKMRETKKYRMSDWAPFVLIGVTLQSTLKLFFVLKCVIKFLKNRLRKWNFIETERMPCAVVANLSSYTVLISWKQYEKYCRIIQNITSRLYQERHGHFSLFFYHCFVTSPNVINNGAEI